MNVIMEKYPWTEVQLRKCAKKLTFLIKIYKKLSLSKKKKIGKQEQCDKEILKNYLKELGIKNGDLLIVHSSLRPLKSFGVSPEDVIEMLMELVGEEGTLVMPAFVAYEEISEEKHVYDINNSPAWTGIITDLFWRREDVTRSKFPDNSLAAWGKYSSEMFANEDKGDLAHGEYSAWKFCSLHQAKVLFLGIPAFNSITEIHLPEDILDENWPVKGWFEERHYEIKNGEIITQKKTRIRKQFWSKYLTEYRCSYELRKQGLLVEETLKNVPISYIPDMEKMENFVTQRALKGDLLIFKVPKKYYKNK